MCVRTAIPREPGTTAILTEQSNRAAAIFDRKVDFGHGVSLGPAPVWVKDKELMVKDWGRSGEDAPEDARFVFYKPYDSATFNDMWPQAEEALRLIWLANLSLWIARPTWIGFDCAYHIVGNSGKESGAEGCQPNPLIGHLRYQDTTIAEGDVDEARKLFLVLSCVPRDTALWTAERFLSSALTNDWWDGRYIMLWVALEALFGPMSGSKITQCLRHRIACFLHQDQKQRGRMSQKVKKLYEWRGKLVHGRPTNGLGVEESDSALLDSEETLRLSLLKILRNPDLTQNFCSEKREEYLEHLVSSG